MAHPITKRLAEKIGSTPKWVKVLVGFVLAVIVAAVAVPVVLMSQPSYLATLDGLSGRHNTLQTSLHTELPCRECHTNSRGLLVRAAGQTADFYRTLLVEDAELQYAKMSSPSNESCLKCHNEAWSDNSERTAKIPHPAHLRVASETRECVGCHKWTAHNEEYLEEHKTMPFSGVCASYGCHAGWKSEDSCSDCHHTLLDKPEEWKKLHPKTVSSAGSHSCLELCHEIKQCQQCHTKGKSPFSGVTSNTDRDRIETLHAQSDWPRRHGQEGLDDQAKCLQCHISVGECLNCHAQRPASHGAEETWIAAHKDAVRSEKQCVTCHKRAWCDECHAQFKEMR